MAKSKSTYHSKVYRDFKSIESRAYHALIRYFEHNETAIHQLDPLERFELWYDYADALYHTGAWRKHLLVVDPVIEFCIHYELPNSNGLDYYATALYQKSVSLYQTREFAQAEYVLRELMKIHPENEAVEKQLWKCRFKQHPNYVDQTRALSVLLFLASASIICVELLWVQHFRPNWVNQVELTRNLLFLAGVLILSTGTLFYRFQSKQEVKRFKQAMLERKINKL